ncbi:hypothetical protein E4T47_04640 [Aureobasidium subglaciale]|nr:hypothetical protein E4T47_04640 [Aureobasidium subglaciale]
MASWAIYQLVIKLQEIFGTPSWIPSKIQSRWCPYACEGSPDQCQLASIPDRAESPGHYTCIVDYLNKPHSITWNGSLQYPDVTLLPAGPDYDLREIDLGTVMNNIWSNSTLVDFGSDAVIRCSHAHPYPMVKIAHTGREGRSRIEHEFQMIQDMRNTNRMLPIPKTSDRPLFDDQGVCGYAMEHLTRLDMEERVKRVSEIQKAVRNLHEAGFSHGDLSLSNVMKNKDGAITLIDFGCTGRLGTQVSECVPAWVYKDAIVTTEPDLQALEQLSVLQ